MTPEEQITLLVIALKHTEASIQVSKIAAEIGLKAANCRYHLKKIVETETGHILDGQSRVRERDDKTAAAAATNKKACKRKRKAEGSAKASPATPVNAKRPRTKKTYTEDGSEDSDGDENPTKDVGTTPPPKTMNVKLEGDGEGRKD